MKLREFTKYLNQISDKKTKLVDLAKIELLPDVIRGQMVKFIVRHRQPIVKELIPKDFDFAWLYSMGYMYESQGKRFTFIHTSEQKVK